MNNSDKKKPLLSGALTGDDNKGFASANADEHNDRITRFATLNIELRIRKIIYLPWRNSKITMKRMLKMKNLSRL